MYDDVEQIRHEYNISCPDLTVLLICLHVCASKNKDTEKGWRNIVVEVQHRMPFTNQNCAAGDL